jgi:cold shock CspA family protein
MPATASASSDARRAALENRKIIGGRIYRGEMQLWNEAQGWGFIKADSDLPLPPHVQARLRRPGSKEELVYVRRADVAPGERLQKGLLVMFQVYIDDKGVGACGLHLI